MFPTSRNNLHPNRSDPGNKAVPIPLGVSLHNVMAELSSSSGQKWFRPQHDTNLLPHLQLQVLVEQEGERRIVYSSPTTTQSFQPSWDHLDEKVDLPGEWWLRDNEDDIGVYQSMKLQFIRQPQNSDPNRSQSKDEEATSDLGTPTGSLFLEVPLYPSKLERLHQNQGDQPGVPEALPPNACLVYYSDGSTRIPPHQFAVLLESQLTEPAPVEDFSRFEDDVFRTLDGVANTPTRERTQSASALLLPQDLSSRLDAEQLAAEIRREEQEKVDLGATQPPLPLQFAESEKDIVQCDTQSERERLEALIAEEEAAIEHDLECLNDERQSLASELVHAKQMTEHIRLVQGETKHQDIQFHKDKLQREAQRMRLLRDLRNVYPITMDSQNGYLIRNLRLPVDVYTTSVPEDEISAALGFCCHLVLMTSKYLSVSLRHRIYCNSSRSAIQLDGASALFPLFTARSVDREHLDRGLVLLGANVECILVTFQIHYTPHSHLLARIKRIFDHILDGDTFRTGNGV